MDVIIQNYYDLEFEAETSNCEDHGNDFESEKSNAKKSKEDVNNTTIEEIYESEEYRRTLELINEKSSSKWDKYVDDNKSNEDLLDHDTNKSDLDTAMESEVENPESSCKSKTRNVQHCETSNEHMEHMNETADKVLDIDEGMNGAEVINKHNTTIFNDNMNATADTVLNIDEDVSGAECISKKLYIYKRQTTRFNDIENEQFMAPPSKKVKHTYDDQVNKAKVMKPETTFHKPEDCNVKKEEVESLDLYDGLEMDEIEESIEQWKMKDQGDTKTCPSKFKSVNRLTILQRRDEDKKRLEQIISNETTTTEMLSAEASTLLNKIKKLEQNPPVVSSNDRFVNLPDGMVSRIYFIFFYLDIKFEISRVHVFFIITPNSQCQEIETCEVWDLRHVRACLGTFRLGEGNPCLYRSLPTVKPSCPGQRPQSV